MVVDDDKAMRDLLALALQKHHYTVRQAADAETALRLLTESPTDGHAEPSDLLISDIHLPGRSGLELLASLRDRQLSIPVIIISAFLTEEVRDDAERLGATSVLSKPFQLSELLSHVHRHLHG